MSETVLQILQALISMFEIWLCNQFLYATILDKESLSWGKKGILWSNVFVSGILLSINRNFLFYSRGMMILINIITWLCVIWMKRSRKILSMLVITLYHLLMTLFDFIVAFGSMIFLGGRFLKTIYFYTISLWRCVIYIIARVLMTVIVRYIVRKKEMRHMLCESQKGLLIMDTILYIIMFRYQFTLVDMSFGSQDMKGGIASMSLLTILFIVVLVGMLFFCNKRMQKENELLTVREAMLRQNCRQLESVLEQNRRLVHDLKNHFLVLKDYERTKNYTGIHDYIEEMEKNYFSMRIPVWTGNRIVDLLLEQKKAVSTEQGIDFLIEAIPVPVWNLNDSELCSLFGNLLDNAIEACSIVTGEKKEIRIDIERQNQLVFIRIGNTTEQKPVMKNGRPISTKADKKIHGYGLKNVERIVDKYDGKIAYQVTENKFQVNIIFEDSKE